MDRDASQSALEVALREATEILAKYSIPLYIEDSAGRPSLHGTGFIVQATGHYYLVSAAHVLDAAKFGRVFYYCAPNRERNLNGTLVRSKGAGDRDRDPIDIAVVKLTGDFLPPYPSVDKYPMPASYLRPRHHPRSGKRYTFIGFPESRSDINRARREATVEPFAFRLDPLNDSAYGIHGLNPSNHIALSLDLRKGVGPDGKPRNFPKPNGMSGSPIIAVYQHEGEDDSRVFPVVAVATKYLKSKRILIGTDVAYVLDAIRSTA